MSNIEIRPFSLSLLLFCLTSAIGYSQQAHPVVYSTPLDNLITNAYPMRMFSDCGIKGDSFIIGSTTVKIGDEIELNGTTLEGGMWHSSIEYGPSLGCFIYSSDLNGDGRDDIVVVTYGGNSSGGYDSALTLFLFDKNGNAIPWQMTGYIRASDKGVKEVATDKRGRAVIVQATRIGHPAWGGVSTGYSLFRVDGVRVAKVEGESMGVAWPYLPAKNPDNPGLSKVLNRSNLTAGVKDFDLQTHSADHVPTVLRYAPRTSVESAETNTNTAGQYPTVNTNALGTVTKQLGRIDI